jgi:hypothetical protein
MKLSAVAIVARIAPPSQRMQLELSFPRMRRATAWVIYIHSFDLELPVIRR